MHLFFEIFGIRIPGYGLMILLGFVVANGLAWIRIRKHGLDVNDWIVMECFAGLGGFLGAKLLYLVVSYQYIEWDRLFSDQAYLASVWQGGFVFYGGVFGGIPGFFAAAKLMKADAGVYLRHLLFVLPLIHGFGRIGCFLAGCCYGVPDHGRLAVVFPEGSMAPSGVPLFPVQLVEAACLFLIAGGLLVLDQKGREQFCVSAYLGSYAAVRFFLERFRADAARGYLGIFSISQWISLFLFFGAAGLLVWEMGKRRRVFGE